MPRTRWSPQAELADDGLDFSEMNTPLDAIHKGDMFVNGNTAERVHKIMEFDFEIFKIQVKATVFVLNIYFQYVQDNTTIV